MNFELIASIDSPRVITQGLTGSKGYLLLGCPYCEETYTFCFSRTKTSIPIHPCPYCEQDMASIQIKWLLRYCFPKTHNWKEAGF
jgi:uncharacterized Zn-finger protein